MINYSETKEGKTSLKALLWLQLMSLNTENEIRIRTSSPWLTKALRTAKRSLQLWRTLFKIAFVYFALWFVNLTSDTVIDPVMGLVACMETIYDPGWSYIWSTFGWSEGFWDRDPSPRMKVNVTFTPLVKFPDIVTGLRTGRRPFLTSFSPRIRSDAE